jgi:hypothetical protein
LQFLSRFIPSLSEDSDADHVAAATQVGKNRRATILRKADVSWLPAQGRVIARYHANLLFELIDAHHTAADEIVIAQTLFNRPYVSNRPSTTRAAMP